MAIRDLSGQRFGRLTAISYAGRIKNSGMWNCVCDCSNKKTVTRQALISGDTRSCGCLKRESTIQVNQQMDRSGKHHGLSGNRFYSIWNSMIGRCHRPNSHNYKRYGGKGIYVCDEWRESPKAFIEWSESQNPPEGYSIDRINNDLPYEPSNCRYLSLADQQRNKSSNHMVEYQGQSYVLAEFARKFGVVGETTVKKRLRIGWSAIDAVLTPVHQKPISITSVTIFEETANQKQHSI